MKRILCFLLPLVVACSMEKATGVSSDESLGWLFLEKYL